MSIAIPYKQTDAAELYDAGYDLLNAEVARAHGRFVKVGLVAGRPGGTLEDPEEILDFIDLVNATGAAAFLMELPRGFYSPRHREALLALVDDALTTGHNVIFGQASRRGPRGKRTTTARLVGSLDRLPHIYPTDDFADAAARLR